MEVNMLYTKTKEWISQQLRVMILLSKAHIVEAQHVLQLFLLEMLMISLRLNAFKNSMITSIKDTFQQLLIKRQQMSSNALFTKRNGTTPQPCCRILKLKLYQPMMMCH